jgi:cytochrome c biogenesis protein CcdA
MFAADLLLSLASAFWFGVLTSISPCPLATNIAAISYVGRKIDRPARVLAAGLLYTAGRSATYLILATLLVSSLLSAPSISHALQKHMNLFMGLLLILAGMVLLELISFNFGAGGTMTDALRQRVEKMGLAGSLLLGVLFALSFCPSSAALFFGSLLPLALKAQSSAVLPAVYGIGTGLPVLVFAVLLAFGANRIAKVYDRVMLFEGWARRVTGIIFVLLGIYYCLNYIFGIGF